jgi:hypothetical protein
MAVVTIWMRVKIDGVDCSEQSAGTNGRRIQRTQENISGGINYLRYHDGTKRCSALLA